jgi:ABC-type lipoprotein export system ATPase subunit
MIRVHHVSKKFSPELPNVLSDINFTISDGEFISLVGRSGSGKSTLLYLLSTLDRDFEGEIFFDQDDVKLLNDIKIHQIRNEQIGFVFQFHYLLNELTAIENILLPARKTGRQDSMRPFAQELLKIVGLSNKEDRFPRQLSGGEQQRVAIARALMMRPKYLFADEPTGNLDSKNGEQVMDLFQEFNQKYQTSIIYVTHDKEFSKRSRRQIELVDGKVDRDSGLNY